MRKVNVLGGFETKATPIQDGYRGVQSEISDGWEDIGGHGDLGINPQK